MWKREATYIIAFHCQNNEAHTHTHTLTWPHSYPVTPDLHPASGVTTLLWLTYRMSGGFSLLHKPPTNEAQKAPSASPLTASVPELRFSTRVWWTCRDAHRSTVTHADWHKSCEWAKWRISRKTHGWLLLSNHRRKWASESVHLVHNWVLTCVPNRPVDDVLISTNQCGAPSAP